MDFRHFRHVYTIFLEYALFFVHFAILRVTKTYDRFSKAFL